MYKLRLSRKAQKFYQQADNNLTSRLNRCFEQLRLNPYKHPNIKPLKGNLAGYLRYRAGDWRVIYSIDESEQDEEQIITILLIAHRHEAYDR